MATATLTEFLKIHPDYRTVTDFHCAQLVNDPERGTVLEPVTITRGFSATLTKSTPQGFYVANVKAEPIGSQSPHFSITGEHWQSESGYRNGADRYCLGMGAMGDELAEIFPELAPFNALHLADAVTGEPMYAFANGWYYYRNGDTDAAARLLRVDSLAEGMSEDDFRAFVVSQRERWEREAEEGRALIRGLA